MLEHSASPHVDDAKDRLTAMSLPIPTPTPEQVAASAALENSRAQYRLKDRATLLFMHQPDVVTAARIGDPPLVDAKPTLAPQVTKQIVADYNAAMNPNAAAAPAPAANTPAAGEYRGDSGCDGACGSGRSTAVAGGSHGGQWCGQHLGCGDGYAGGYGIAASRELSWAWRYFPRMGATYVRRMIRTTS